MNTQEHISCAPTWQGRIETTRDALIVFEACLTGYLRHCLRRPTEAELPQLIASGNVFVYDEATSGIKRWIDGKWWSPSRTLANFFLYRQLSSPLAPEKRNATRRSARIHRTNTDDNPNRPLVGSLVDSYDFKENGLVKRTISIKVQDAHHHLVSYYSLDDVNNLTTPRDDSLLKDLCIREALLHQPPFKDHLDDDGTWREKKKLGAYPSSCPGSSYPQYYPRGLPYLMPQYQVPPQQAPTVYQSDQHPFQHINHALQYPNALQQACLNQDPYEDHTFFEGKSYRVDFYGTQPYTATRSGCGQAATNEADVGSSRVGRRVAASKR